ncbi:rhomboid family intramembrane serine protease [Rhodococcus sp. HNM0569]|uniref:rhomboid family intramembrane serine protease n=1 Tax=Rhodococcus sp. HNM0569 TaxID=2716340 RepID=UPI003211D09E
MNDLPTPRERAEPATGRPRWQRAALITLAFTVALYVIEAVDTVSGDSLQRSGVAPRTVDGLWGVLFAPVLHSTWGHLFANTVPVLVLGFLVLLPGIGRGLTATAVVWIVGGLGTWLTAGAHTNHIGASVLVFGWLTYVVARGFFLRDFVQILIGVVVFVLYGGLLWGVFPTSPLVSWQGHLFGALGGVLAAWALASDARRDRRTERRGRPPELRG